MPKVHLYILERYLASRVLGGGDSGWYKRSESKRVILSTARTSADICGNGPQNQAVHIPREKRLTVNN